MCLYPTLGKNRKFTKTIKNGGIIPAVIDRRTEYVPFECGKCMECRKKKAREWLIRLSEDIKVNKNGKFITLTFSNESIAEIIEYEKTFINDKGEKHKTKLKTLKGYKLDNEIATVAIRLFLERWRKKYKKSLRHWLITELGHKGTENIHIHGIIWTDEELQTVKEIWKYGYIWPRYSWKESYVNDRTINYITKYVNKQDQINKNYKPIILNSAGIGINYIYSKAATRNKYNGKETDETYKTNSGYRISLPIYYRNKLYTDNEKERLWINKLDKEIRYVCGEKIDISKEQKTYEETVEHYRKINKQLGYGTPKNYNNKQYEEDRRTIAQMTRIKKGQASTP
ncbi:MAG: replication initiator protein [Microviridae sp.]|nr:MAG: replication initiator protein [Microviridae sp.]